MLEEVCDLNPQKKCRSVTKLVPRLKSTHRCTIVPQEICQLQFSSPLQPGEIYPPEEKLFFACAAAQQADQIETVIKPYIEWGVKEKSETSADFDTEIPRPNSPEKDTQENTTPGIKGLRAPKSNEQRPRTLGPQGSRNLGPQEPRELMSQGPKEPLQVITRHGWIVKKPMRFQS